ncbi:MAG TPA: DUF397 domain-containing protein [Actinocatenispora sp.]
MIVGSGGGRWRKSTRSQGQQNCVEVMDLDDGVVVRDSKDPRGPVLTASNAAWRTFLAVVTDGERVAR